MIDLHLKTANKEQVKEELLNAGFIESEEGSIYRMRNA